MGDKTVVVTGGNSGIGLETAAALAAMGARVLLTARSAERGRSAVAEITSRLGSDPRIQLVVFDLADLSSVRRGAAEILEQAPTLDVLVNNAGLVLSARSETVDGLEYTFATNHLGPFLLTNLLLDRLRASAPSRVVTVSSGVHTRVPRGLRFDDLQSERRYRGAQVYAETKLANVLFTRELARRLDGTGVTANALHPGAVRSGYGQDGDTRGLISAALTVLRPFFITPQEGARTSVYLASSPDVEGVSGQYFVKSAPAQPSASARDPEAALRLWQVSEQLVGLAPEGRADDPAD